MPEEEVLTFLRDWIVERVSAVAENGFPICPYALQALLSDKVRIVIHGGDDLGAFAEAGIASFDPALEMLVIVERNLSKYSPDWAKSFCDGRNAVLRARDRIVLCDHPWRPGRIGSTITSNGRYLLLFVQQFGRLEQASRALHATDYYAAWPADFYEEIVASRR